MNKTFIQTARDMTKAHGGLIFLCFLMIFFSVFGQSIFFGVYLPMIREDLGLSKTYTGALYAIATIGSAIAIIFTGKKLDDYPLQYFVAGVLIMLAIGCFAMSFAHSALVLFIAFFILRHFGQGLMVLSSSTSVNRYMDKNRGKAVAISGLGGALHMMIFPILALSLNEFIDWRHAWQLYGLFVLCVLTPFFWWGLRHHQTKRHHTWEARIKAEKEQPVAEGAHAQNWTRLAALKHWRFYAIVAITFLSPFVGTVVFFYQYELANSLSLTPLAFAASFPLFTIASIIASLVAGSVIDKFGEKPALILYPILYAIALFLMTAGWGLAAVYIAMLMIGAANGIMSTTGGPLLSRLYGTEHLGGIKSMLFSSTIIASALSPFLFGMLMDQGIDILTLFFWCGFYAAFIWILAFPICRSAKST